MVKTKLDGKRIGNGCFWFRLGSTLISENETIPTNENNLKVTGPTQEVGKKN